MLLDLHWLPISERIIYKIAVLAHTCYYDRSPTYLKDMINKYTPSRQLRSSNHLNLLVPRKGSKRLSCRTFFVAAPDVWNALPHSLKSNLSDASLRNLLKPCYLGTASKIALNVLDLNLSVEQLLLRLESQSIYCIILLDKHE